jgi:hypothetical protein
MMTKIPLRNKELIRHLDKFHKFRTDYVDLLSPTDRDLDGKWYTSEKYLQIIRDMKVAHDGFPEKIYSHSFQHSQTRLNPDAVDASTRIPEMNDYYNRVLSDISRTYCWKHTALATVYPPGGFISWHNNANAPGHNMIFTWSEKGDGWFKYWDPKKEEIVTMQDEPGWNAKIGYFGSYSDGWNNICYHAAYAPEAYRMTVSFVYATDERSTIFRDMLVEEMQYEE